MRLKKLILQGFKSFADRTEFVFDSPITGIVGPNGCGKSNVVDGFKWVLGEQSAKSLRGDAMLDVIFNGSSARKPAGLAEVTLVFENPKRPDESRVLNLDVDEVSVGRRLYRDGTSEYQINNHTSRLKDVRELFLDTGVGVDAYSVIEQGRVSALLEANPDERRLIFEEAAGISKFKAKKKESQRKLEKVDQNLLRVTDIVEEVEKRLRSVKIQAGRARTYQEHTARLGELRLTYSLHEYHTLHTQLLELEAKQEDARFRLDDINGDLQRAQNELAVKRDELDAVSQSKQRNEYELIQARSQAEQAQQRQQFAEQQLQQMAEQIEAFERDRELSEEKLTETRDALEMETRELARFTDELEAKRIDIDHRQQAFRDGQLQLNTLAKEVEQAKGTILDVMRKLAQINNRISSVEIERRNIGSHQSRLAERRRVVIGEVDALDAQCAELTDKLETTLTTIQVQQIQMNVRRDEAASLGQQIKSLTESLGSAKEHRSGLLSRQKLLQDLEARREGVSEGVKAVLRQREEKFPFIRSIVADVLRVDVEHATVIEAALNGADQTLITETQAAAIEAGDALHELNGRVNILCLDELRGTGGSAVSPVPSVSPVSPVSPVSTVSSESERAEQGRGTRATEHDWNVFPHRVRLAIDLVRFESEYQPLVDHLLGRTIIVDDREVAHELHNAAPPGFRFVTHAGEVLEADGTFRAGPLTAAMGILSRRSELDAIVAQIADVDQRIVTLTHQLTDNNAQAKSLEDETNALRNAIYASNTAKVELTSSIAQIGDKLAALHREQPLLDRELTGLLEQVGRLKDEDTTLLATRGQMEHQQATLQSQVEEMTAKQTQIAEHLSHFGEELTAARVALGQVQEKQLASEQHVQRHSAAIVELEQQIERLSSSAQAVASRRGSVEAELQNAKRQELQLVESQQQLQGQVEALKAQIVELQQIVGELESTVNRAREQHGEIEQAMHATDVSLGEVRVRLEALVKRTLDESQLDLPAQYETVGYQPNDTNWDAIGDEIKQLREKIQRLGNVNLDAMGEQDELETRAKFMGDQLLDLRNGKLQLEELIDTINKESSIRFEETFNAVREHFQGMFRKLFGGGKADVFLKTEIDDDDAVAEPIVGPDGQTMMPIMRKTVDPLDAGIEIMAHPPGKKPATISQLSGGEKTMTCIALLMSIFKSKPSPFCILDEVDAALDEANNQRFNLIVQEFLEQSQFIVITHSKRTMQIADVLYGVTMQEQGVSKRVAVKFDQVAVDGRIAKEAVEAADAAEPEHEDVEAETAAA